MAIGQQDQKRQRWKFHASCRLGVLVALQYAKPEPETEKLLAVVVGFLVQVYEYKKVKDAPHIIHHHGLNVHKR